MKKRMNRRAFLRMAGGAAAGAALAACQPQTVVVEKEVLKEVEKIVTQVVKETVKETVIVEGTPKVIEKEVEKLVTVAPVEMEPVTITWMNWWGAHREVLMLEIIARFQEEFPHITVENQVQPWDNREQRAATAIASQDPPSLIMVPRVESQKFAYEGLIIPIDPYIEAKGYDVYDIFVESDINNCRWEDQFWSYPLPSGGVDSSFWLYNKNMMRDAGLDPEKPPTTWQEVEQVIEATTKIVDGDLETCGLTGVGSGNFPKWLYCNDGQYYGDDSKQLLFNQEEGVQTLEWMIGLIDKMGGIDAYNAYTQVGTDALEADFKFYHDTLCMFAPNVSIFGHIQATAPEFYEDTERWGVTLVPYNGNNPQAKATGLSGFAFSWNQVIPKGLEQKVQDAAYEWLEYFTMRRAGGCWFLFEQARPSPVKACNENPDYYAANPYWDVILQALAIDKSVPVTPVQSQIADLVTEAVDEVWFGMTSPQEALDWAHEQTQPILDAFWSGS
jgi:multiple sugar transport system substrate-binding protein